MTVLLDTHTFLWFVVDDAQLSTQARTLMEDPTNDVLVSPASYWEIAIKVGLGKLDLRSSTTNSCIAASLATTLRFCQSSQSIPAYSPDCRCIIGTHSIGCWWRKRRSRT